jgi:signal transduction histidine kinase
VLDIHSIANYDREKNIVYGMVQDITEHKRVEQILLDSEIYVKGILNTLTAQIAVLNENGVIITVNETWKKFALSNNCSDPNFYLGSNYITVCEESITSGDSSADTILHGLRSVLDGNLDQYSTEYPCHSPGTKRWFSLTVLPQNKPSKGLIVVHQDISKRKQAEEVIKQKNEELVKLNSEKDKFFSIIAHDLKSPFQGLIGYSEILTKEYNSLSEEEKINFINSISELSKSSYKLLQNLLDWSRLQTGNMIFTPEKFNVLLEFYHTLSLKKQTAQNKAIEFNYEIDDSIYIYADKNMLLTVIRNLISNAIKFTNKGGKITLRVIKMNKTIEFSVCDNGVGIQKDRLDKIFSIDNNKSSKGTANEAGTGLGLMLCEELVEKHNGKIWCESIAGTGSKFFFTIPE